MRNVKTDAQCAPYFTASGLRSTPSHRDDGPNDLPPKQPLPFDARSTCRGPTHTGLRSSANNLLSKYTPDLARWVASRREPQAEPELPKPLARLDPSLLLLAWWLLSPSLVPQRSRFGVMILPFLPRYSNFGWRVRKGTKNLAGKSPPPDSDPFSDGEFEKIAPACQANSPHAQVAASSSINAASF